MAVSFQEIVPTQTVGSLMDASRLTAQQFGLQPNEAELERDWNGLAEAATQASLTGEMFLDIPYITRSTKQLVEGMNSVVSGTVVDIVYPELWIPGKEVGSYSHKQQAKGSAEKMVVSMAVHSTNNNEPLLHFLDQPFDRRYAKDSDQTQEEAIAKWQQELVAQHPDLNAGALSVRGVLLIAQNRLNMPKTAKMLMDWGYMRDGTLARTSVVDGSIVGSVCSTGSRLLLGGYSGVADPYFGVGFRVGLAEAQSSEA